MKKAHPDALATVRRTMDRAQVARLKRAAALPDADINTRDPDAREVTDWSGAVRGRFYRPVGKTSLSRSLDAISSAHAMTAHSPSLELM